MVELAQVNAKANGIQRFSARTGFGEAPPFPAAGEAPFDLVLSSGVISFAPDHERWLDGLVSTLAPRATLVIGDLEPASRGMQRRRAERALLPVRELNARSPAQVRAALEKRGLRFVAGRDTKRAGPCRS
jgi:trans-aconitate methyltransferase